MKKLLIVSLGVICIFLLSINIQAGQAPMGNLDPRVAPPNSEAFGMSLGEWLEAYSIWYLTGEPESGKIGNVQFLPLPDNGHLDIEIEVGTALVFPMFFYVGEEYVDGTEDDPFPTEWWGDPDFIHGDVTIDGKPIFEPNADYYVEPIYYDTPIVYDEPQPRPPSPDAAAAIFVQGIVCVLTPLTPGVHEIFLKVYFGDSLLFDNSWTITVVPKGKK